MLPTNSSVSLSSVAAVIPARLAATRLPRKPLARIGGKPMIQHVYERTSRVPGLATILVATPDKEIFDVVEAFGGRAIMTADTHRTGSDRVAEAALNLPEEIEVIVNVQGDEPLIEPETIARVAQPLVEEPGLVMASVMCPLPTGRETDPNVVKVVCALNGNALYFSRSPLPYRRTEEAHYAPHQHVGLYAYRRSFLRRLPTLAPTPLEQVESLEQLRVLEHGYAIRMVQIERAPESVDTPTDLLRVQELLGAHG